MSNFKVGDKVRRKDGNDFRDGSRVQKIDGIDEFCVWLDHGLWVDEKDIEHVKTPRKHADLIHRWADDDSMVIERLNTNLNEWFKHFEPCFYPDAKYREYKPERKQIENKIRKLETELKELKEQLNND